MKQFIFLLLLPLTVSFAGAQTGDFTSYFTGDTADVVVNPTGGVTLMGGAGENDVAMRWFLARADGGDVVVLRYSGSDGYNNYFYTQLGATINSVETIVFQNDQAAFDPYVLRRIAEADAIWFAGGDQWNYVRGWRNTPVDSTINARVQQNVPVGGTSAGMAILGGTYFSAENGTITSADALANPYATAAAVDATPFLALPYLENTIADTHYDNPAREGRHTAFLARAWADGNSAIRGIACDEYTAVCIAPDGKAYVYGAAPTYDDFAYFIRPNCELADASPETCQPGQALTWDRSGAAVRAYVINGDSTANQYFDLADWTTGTGGSWETWSVSNGSFARTAAAVPNCLATDIEPAHREGFSLYPNPATNCATLELPAGLAPTQIRLRDHVGKELAVPMEQEGHRWKIHLAGLPGGFYVVEVVFEGDWKGIPLIRQ